MRRLWLVLTLGFALAFAGPAMADVWDWAADNDNTTGTDTELVHKSSQIHDLGVQSGVADQDWYVIGQKPYSSYEVVIDGTTGDIGYSFDFDRVDSGGTVLQSYSSVSPVMDYAKYLAWQNNTASEITNQFIRVMNPVCGTDCSSNDQYTIRAFETTYAIPRFNNASGQITVLLIQNPTNYSIAYTAHFWNASGTLLGSYGPYTLPAKRTLVLNTNTLAYATGQSGAITVSNTGRYGDLAGKTVALEAATGFSFDSPMLPRP